MSCGIYKIESKTSGRVYIGQSINIEKRWKEHDRSLKSGSHFNVTLQRTYNKYGANDLTYSVALECDPDQLASAMGPGGQT